MLNVKKPNIHYRSPTRLLGIIGGVILIAVTVTTMCSAQSSDLQQVVVSITESSLKLSDSGGTVRDCIRVQTDGRVIIARMKQQLSPKSVTIATFEVKLDDAQLQHLRGIISAETIAELPPFAQPPLPVATTVLRGFKVAIPRQSGVQTIGYFELSEQDNSEATTSILIPDKLRDDWKHSEKALRPLVDWVSYLFTLKLVSASDRSHLCSGDTTIGDY